jgi:8-oxo-dGTP diphosphatase
MKKTIRVTGCILSYGNEMLMLHRSKKETDPSLWGIPAGKVELNEPDEDAVLREVFEETGIRIEDGLDYLGQMDIEYESMTVQFPIFHKLLNTQPVIVLDPEEHINYRWMKPSDVLELPDLMLDVDKIVTEFCIKKHKL